MIKQEKIYSVVAKKIREERRRQNLTQEKLSELVDITPKFMSNIESNRNRPSLELVIKIASVLDVPLISMFVDDNNKDKSKDDLIGQIKYMLSDLTQEQQDIISNLIINTIKEAKKLIK